MHAEAILTECLTALSLEKIKSAIPRIRATMATIASMANENTPYKCDWLSDLNYLNVINVLIIYIDLILITKL